MLTLIQTIVCLPVSIAMAERSFSQININAIYQQLWPAAIYLQVLLQ